MGWTLDDNVLSLIFTTCATLCMLHLNKKIFLKGYFHVNGLSLICFSAFSVF